MKNKMFFLFKIQISSTSFTFSNSLKLAVKLLASDLRRAHNMGGGACLDMGGASSCDVLEWGRARRKASE